VRTTNTTHSTPVNLYQSTRYHIIQDNTLYCHWCEHLK